MGEREMERRRQLKAECEYVQAAGSWWNYDAQMDEYAGWRNPERAYAIGSLLSELALQWYDLPERARKDLLRAARGILGERHDGKRGWTNSVNP
jgi:hypothetical protein